MYLNKTYVEADWDGNDGVIGPIGLDWRGGPGIVQITVGGTIDYDVEFTNSDIQSGQTPDWVIDDATTQDGATGNLHFAVESFPRFMRIVVNSSTDATVNIDIVQQNG